MKKTILLLLALTTLTALAHDPEFSMYKKEEPPKTKEAKFSSAQKGCYWLAFSGVALIGVSTITQIKNSIEIPDRTKFETTEQFNTEIDKYDRHQLSYKTAINASITVAGLSIILASGYFLESKIFESEKTVLHLKSNGNSIGLCLNFK